MSHIAKIEMEINDLGALQAAAIRLGGELVIGQTNYKWYGEWIGNTPMPEGVTADNLGKCDHAIRRCDLVELAELSKTERGEGGFGSTGMLVETMQVPESLQ